jgi:hypothetical protein
LDIALEIGQSAPSMNTNESNPNDEQPDPLLDEVETLVFHADDRDDPRNTWVRLVHRETGIEVESTTESTQTANRQRALTLLRDLLGR